jgi:SNF2 family DNA or RNA helicase
MSFDYSQVDMDTILRRVHSEMTPLQIPGVERILNSPQRSGIFAVWKGVGKTLMALTAGLYVKPQTFLVVCSGSARATWQNQIIEWFPEFSAPEHFCHVAGSPQAREHWWRESQKAGGPLFYVVTPQAFERDVEFIQANNIHFDVIWCDEPQIWGLRNDKSAAWKMMKSTIKFASDKKKAIKLFGIATGSLTSKGVFQMWPYLHLVDRHVFSSKWNFMHDYTWVIKSPFGSEPGLPKNTEKLAAVCKPYIYVVNEKKAAQELPPLVRRRLDFELDPVTRAAYKDLAHKMYVELPSSEKIFVAKNPLHQLTALRKIVCCPQIADPQLPLGNAIEAVKDKILESQEEKHYRHVAVFTPYVPSIPLFKTFLAAELKLPEDHILTLQGGATPDDITKVEKIYRANQETLFLGSLSFAQSFNLETGREVYFPHFDWDQEKNSQAESRTRRQTSNKERTIIAHYCMARDTIAMAMKYVLNMKHTREYLTYQYFETEIMAHLKEVTK